MTNSFEKVLATTQHGVEIIKYASRETGLAVVVANVDSPLVNGYFVLSTEAHDDKGLPHTLEHFVFLGSEEYPYKGVLDTLSNRCLAQGTNAWTDTDHTCYTISTAGAEGFLIILPVYLDHILYPTLTDTAFHTEIHHVNGEGEDAGVVYCEMQGRENTAEDRLHLRIQQTLYPAPSGYRHETGGLMADLRTLTADEVRAYHRANYLPDNLTIVVTGRVDHEALLRALAPVEAKIVQRGAARRGARPWLASGPVPAFPATVSERVEFPDESEATGTVHVCWRTHAYRDFLDAHALDVLHTYLTESAVSLLQRTFVETADPLCSDVSFSTVEALSSAQILSFSNVPVAKLDELRPLLFATLAAELESGIDMDRMAMVVQKSRERILSEVETDPHSYFSGLIIGDAIYGDRLGAQLREVLDETPFLDQLSRWTAADWAAVARRFLLDAPYYCLVGAPSTALAQQLQDDERARVAEQRAVLGPERLAELGRELADACAANDEEIPDELIESFPVPTFKTVAMPQVCTLALPALQGTQGDPELARLVAGFDESRLPCRIQLDHVASSQFVTLQLVADSSGLSATDRLHLEVFLREFFQVAVRAAPHEILAHDEVVRLLNRDTVGTYAGVGRGCDQAFACGSFSQCVIVEIKATIEKYAAACAWLDRLVSRPVWDAERLQIAVAKTLNDVPAAKRDGSRMLDAAARSRLYSPAANYSALSILAQAPFLQTLQSAVTQNHTGALETLETLRKRLFRRDTMRLHIAGNLVALENLLEPWTGAFNVDASAAIPLAPAVQYCQTVLSPLGKQLGGTGHCIVEMPSIESSFALHTGRGPSRFDDPDLLALRVASEMLHTMEGYFWKEIRGNGLAYGASLHLDVESGLLSLSIYRSPDASKAFDAARAVVGRLCHRCGSDASRASSGTNSLASDDSYASDDDEQLDPIEFEAAKSSVAFGIISKEETAASAADESFVNQQLKQLSASANHDALLALERVTLADCERVMAQYIAPLFDAAQSVAAIVAPPSKLSDVRLGYARLGFQLECVDSGAV